MNESIVASGGHDPQASLARSFLDENPFLDNAVSDVAGAVVDVPEVHDRQFRMLIEYAEEVRRRRGHVGQVVWGEPGVGKSHLLARFSRWAENGPKARCVFLHNLQPSPEALPRYVLKCVVQRLVGGRRQDLHRTELHRLLNAMVRKSLQTYRPDGDGPPTAAETRECFRRWVDEFLAEHPNAGPDARLVYDVLFAMFLSSYAVRFLGGDGSLGAIAVRWLSGEGIERDEAARLRMRCPSDPDAVAMLSGSDAIETVLIVLAQIASVHGQPLVLCFDQVDNLSVEQFRALTQFLHPLIDHAENLLVLLSGVRQKIVELREAGGILGAAWERIAQNERGVELLRISPTHAEAILQARIRPFRDQCRALPAAQALVERDPLFPLGSEWFAQWIGPLVEVRPRDVINWARERWRDLQSRLREQGAQAWLVDWPGACEAPPAAEPPPAADEPETLRRIDDAAARLLGEQVDRRIQEPESLPADADNLCGLTRRLLERCLGDSWEYGLREVTAPPPEVVGRMPTHHLWTKPHDGAAARPEVALTFVATSSATSTTAALRRLVQSDGDPKLCMLLVTDERAPLTLGTRGREYIKLLHERGRRRFQEIELTLRDYAALDAMQGVLGRAESGDIEIELSASRGTYKRVTADEIVASYHRHDRFRQHRLLGAVLGASLPAEPQTPVPDADPQPAGKPAPQLSPTVRSP